MSEALSWTVCNNLMLNFEQLSTLNLKPSTAKISVLLPLVRKFEYIFTKQCAEVT